MELGQTPSLKGQVKSVIKLSETAACLILLAFQLNITKELASLVFPQVKIADTVVYRYIKTEG